MCSEALHRYLGVEIWHTLKFGDMFQSFRTPRHHKNHMKKVPFACKLLCDQLHH